LFEFFDSFKSKLGIGFYRDARFSVCLCIIKPSACRFKNQASIVGIWGEKER